MTTMTRTFPASAVLSVAASGVPRLGEDDHERIDPLSELAEMVHPDKIVVVHHD